MISIHWRISHRFNTSHSNPSPIYLDWISVKISYEILYTRTDLHVQIHVTAAEVTVKVSNDLLHQPHFLSPPLFDQEIQAPVTTILHNLASQRAFSETN